MTASRPVDADTVAGALADVPGVRLHPVAAAATHLPGRRVGGVRLTQHGAETDAEVHVVVAYPTTVADAASVVREALAPLGLSRVDVVVEDVVRPEDLAADDAAPDGPGPDDGAPDLARPPDTGGSHG